MDRSAVKAIVDREIEPMMERLGIPHWHIVVGYEGLEGETSGDCTRKIDYNQASIRFAPDALDDEEHVLKVLRHELYHVVLSPFDLYSCAVDRALETSGSPALPAVLDRVWRHSCEQAVINLERMYQCLSPEPAAKKNPRRR